MIGFLRETLGTFLLTLLVVVAYSTAMVCLWGFMLDYLFHSWDLPSWVEITLYFVWVVFHMLWAGTITYKREKSMNRDDVESEDGE